MIRLDTGRVGSHLRLVAIGGLSVAITESKLTALDNVYTIYLNE